MDNSKVDTPVTNPPPASTGRQIVLKEIVGRWSKFSEQDLSSLKNRDDIITQVVAKYGVEKIAAQRDVDTLMNGRNLTA